jgi:hypothetical protein
VERDIVKRIEDLMDLFDEGEVTTADKIERPEDPYRDFMERNPMAGGGMLVQPSADGSRPGYAAPSGYQPKIELIKNPRNPLLKNKFGFRTQYDIPEGTPGYLGKAGERRVFNTKADAQRFIKKDLPKIISPVSTDETKIAQIKKLFGEGKTNQQVATELKTTIGAVKNIKKNLGLDTVQKTKLETIKQKYLKLKKLAEKTNKGFKYTQMKDLLKQVGLRGDYAPSDIKNFKKYNVPKLESAQDKVKKAFKFLTSNPNKPVEELFNFNAQIAKLTGTNQNQVSMILGNTQEYIDFKPVMNKLVIPASRARLTGKGMVLADLIEEVENVRPIGTGGSDILRSARNTPEYFIMESAKKHVNQGGTKVEFTRMPGNLDETGKRISTIDAEFIYKGKKYTYDDLLRTGRKNFPEVYKAFDDMDELLNRSVIHPVTKQETNFSTLMKEVYNKGAGYSYDRIPYAIDHIKQVKEEPFNNLRVTSARLNSSAGVLKQKEFEAKQGVYGPEKTELYAPEKVEKYLKKMGYNFPKDPNKLFNDEVKLANDILVKKRVLKKPIQIAIDYEKSQKAAQLSKQELNNALADLAAKKNPGKCGRKIGATGGRVGLKFGSTECALEAKKYLDQIITKGTKDKSEQLLANKILAAGRSLKDLASIRGTLGPAALVLTAASEAGLVGYDVLAKGKTLNEAVADSVINPALGPKLKQDSQKLFVERLKNLGLTDQEIGKGLMFDRMSEDVQTLSDLFQRKFIADQKVEQAKKFSPVVLDKRKKAASDIAMDIQDIYRTRDRNVLDAFEGRFQKPETQKIFTDAAKRRQELEDIVAADQRRAVLKNIYGQYFQGERGREKDEELISQYFDLAKEDVNPAIKNIPGARDVTFIPGKTTGGLFGFADGGITGLSGGDTSGPPPERGPNPQGLPSLLKRVRNM